MLSGTDMELKFVSISLLLSWALLATASESSLRIQSSSGLLSNC